MIPFNCLLIASIDIKGLFNVIEGKKFLIASSKYSEMLLNFRLLLAKEIQDDWLNALSFDFNYEIRIVNIKNPQCKQIIKLINLSFEHGIIMRRDRLFQRGMLMLYYLVEKFAPKEIIDVLDKVMSKRRIEITFNELESLFLILLIGLSLSICQFVIELISSIS